MTYALVGLLLVELLLLSLNAPRRYRRFKALTLTEDRQRAYRRFALSSIVCYSLVPIGVLAILRRLGSVLHAPIELHVAHSSAATAVAMGLVGGITGGVLLGAAVSWRRKAEPVLIGDIASLLPRNGAERRLGARLSFCAGIGEELWFRLTLPLLLVLVGVPALWALAIPVVLFGLAHSFQGVAGVIGTMVIGAILAVVYAGTQQLWLAMALHTIIDLNALVLRPWLSKGHTPLGPISA